VSKKDIEKIEEAYREKHKKPQTWSGLPVKEFYRPDDSAGSDYEREIADPGKFPYTRGIHRDMYRGRYWTRREVTGFGTPMDTNERLKFLITEGSGGLNVIIDVPTNLGLDSDHPRARGEIGVQGVPISSISDVEEIFSGIPIERISVSLIVSSCITPVVLAQYLAMAESRGLEIGKLSGTTQNDPIHTRFCGIRMSAPLDLAYKTGVDTVEYCTRNLPRWYPININLYDLREQGINAAQEIGFGFSMAMLYIRGVLDRDLQIDEFGPRLAFYCSAHMDLFEEVAKLRAARRLWARIMKERFGARDEKSLQFRFGVHTAGCSLVPQQPLNNIVRIAYQALAAVLAGVQSLHCCSFDEPIALPTEEAVRVAIRTQQILAYETGVANVSDPLGGSYYVEELTDRIEKEAVKIIEEIESRGGMMEVLKNGWIDQELEKAALRYQKEVESGERIIVGANAFQIPPEEDFQARVHRISSGAEEIQLNRVKRFKSERDFKKTREAVRNLKSRAEEGEKINLIPAMIEAARAKATLSEVLGTVRQVYGHPYDPFEVISNPFI